MPKIPQDVLDILGECRVEGNTLFLPDVLLDRKTYAAVNKVLENMGGKWSRKAQGHIFQDEDNPGDMLEAVLLNEEVRDLKKEYQFFPTPRHIAERMCAMAELDGSCRVVEPSCGDGRLADVIADHYPLSLSGVEINPDMFRKLAGKPYQVMQADFLALKKDDVGDTDRMIMNPPFCKHQDIDHILHAYNLLDSGGILVSVVCESPFFRSDKKSVAFREFLDEHGAEVHCLDAGEFHESGTEIRTRLIKLKKDGGESNAEPNAIPGGGDELSGQMTLMEGL